MADTLVAAPAQGEIHQPLSDTGKSILSTIFDAPVRPEEVKRDVDLKELKKELGDKFQDKPVEKTEEPKKSAEDEEKEFTKQFQKKDDDTEVLEPEKKVEKEEKKDEKKEVAKEVAKTDATAKEEKTSEVSEDDEAKGKIKNINDARKLWKEHKKLVKEHAELKLNKDKEITEAKDELQKLKDAPKPDQAAIDAQLKELAELKAEREFIQKQAQELDQRAAAYSVQDTEPYKRLVIKPLEAIGSDLDDLVQSISEDKGDQQAMYQDVGRALSIEDPKLRRKAFEELGAPLTAMQQAELIAIEKGHKRVMADKAKILGDSQTAMKIIKEKQEMDRKEWVNKNTNEFRAGAIEARTEMKKMYKFFERNDLPDDVKAQITELESAIEKIDPSQLPAKEVGKITEAYYRGKILNDAASRHIKAMEEQEKKYKADLEKALKEIEDLKKNQKTKEEEDVAKKQAVDGTRPNLDTGNTNTDTPGRVDTIEGMVSNLFRV